MDKGQVQYALMDLTSLDRQEYYNGFANRALWPIMHYRIGLSEFSRADYQGYLRVNRTFANALAQLIRPDDLVWVHDYHLIPLAAELRAIGITNLIGYFHHIPWPAPEVLGALPGSRELLRAVMDYDLVGVHTERDADNLRRGLIHELGPFSTGQRCWRWTDKGRGSRDFLSASTPGSSSAWLGAQSQTGSSGKPWMALVRAS